MEKDAIKNSTDEVLEARKARRDLKIELISFFVLGILLGITLKSEAVKKITIGYNDYKVKTAIDDYNVSQLKADMIEQAQKEAMEEQETTETEQNVEEAQE